MQVFVLAVPVGEAAVLVPEEFCPTTRVAAYTTMAKMYLIIEYDMAD